MSRLWSVPCPACNGLGGLWAGEDEWIEWICCDRCDATGSVTALPATDDELAALRRILRWLKIDLNDFVCGQMARASASAGGEIPKEDADAAIARSTQLWYRQTGIKASDVDRLAALIEGDGR